MNLGQHHGPFIALAHAYRDLEDEYKPFPLEKFSEGDFPEIQEEDMFIPTTVIDTPRQSSATKSSILNMLDAAKCKHLHRNIVEGTR